MNAGSGSHAVAGGLARHVPVLVRRAIDWLDVHDGGLYVDGTFGAGGFSRAIFLAAPGARVIGIDRDQRAIAGGAALVAEASGRLELVEDRFSNLRAILACEDAAIDGVVFDLGVSSMQLDEAERGFSFRLDGPLDMRMGRNGPSAADVVARASERDLAAVFFTLGEERHARSIARAIVRARAERAIATTGMLAEIVARAVPARPALIHPATRAFQALRIFVNDELAELAQGLVAAERVLKAGGRLVVIAFHSLEDRIVKNFLGSRSRAPAASRHRPQAIAAAPTFRVLTKRPETPDEAETDANPRARSAKLRAAERTDAAAPTLPSPASGGGLGRGSIDALLPRLPSLEAIMRGRP